MRVRTVLNITLGLTVAVGLTALIAVTSSTTSSTADAQEPAATETQTGGTSSSQGVTASPPRVMERIRTSTDSLPTFVDPSLLGRTGLIAESTRLLSVELNVAYYAVNAVNKELCIVVVLGGESDFVAASGCAALDTFDSRGTGVSLTGPAGKAEAYLVPDGFVASAVEQGFEAPTENLLLRGPATGKVRTIELRGAGRAVQLALLESPIG